MKIRIDNSRMKNILMYSLLFLCSMNFLAKFHYFVYALFVFLILLQKARLHLNQKIFVYLALNIVMALYSMDEGVLSALRCFSSFMMYVVGFNLAMWNRRVESSENAFDRSFEGVIYTAIVSICIGSFSHFLLNAVINIGSVIGRNTIDVWSGEVMAATQQACLASLVLGLAVAVIFKPLKRYQKYLGIACIVAVLAYNFVLSGRALIVLLCALCFVCALYMNKVEANVRKKLSFLLTILVCVLLLGLAFVFDVGGLKTSLMQTNLFERFSNFLNFFDNSARNEAKMRFIVNGWKYPFGGNHMLEQYGYAHDLLLDGYDEFGIFGFLLLVAVLLMGVTSFYKLMRQPCYSSELKIIFLGVYVSMLLVFCIEPILAGMVWLFVMFCFINGIMDGMRCTERRNKGEIK